MAEAYLTAFTGLYYLFPFETIKAYVGKASYLDYLVNVLLHCLEQPPPPVNDTNPYNVFRPREKVHRLHTRRMQRRENNVQSFEKLRQVRRNLGQAQSILEALIKREEKKRDVMDSEVSLQRIQLQYRHETELLEDSLAMPGFQPTTTSYKFGSSDDELMDSDDHTSTRVRTRPAVIPSSRFTNLNLNASHPGGIKQEVRRRQSQHGWLHRLVKPSLTTPKLSLATIINHLSKPVMILFLRILMNR
jgi:hypothetical protein